MMNSWTLRQRILASFSAVLALMIAMGAVAYTCLARVAQDADFIQKENLPGLSLSVQLMAAWSRNFKITQALVGLEGAEPRQLKESELQANRYLSMHQLP